MERELITNELHRYGYDSDTIARFLAYHELHKWAWKIFESCALKLITAGKRHIGAKQIVEEIRYHQPEPRIGLTFKINNNYTALYARVFVIKYPQYRDRIELREVSGLKPEAQTSLELKGAA